MSQITDAKVAAWQEHAGLKPAWGKRLEALEEMSTFAFELIKCIELEKAGIRDGDGPIGGSINDLNRAYSRMNESN